MVFCEDITDAARRHRRRTTPTPSGCAWPHEAAQLGTWQWEISTGAVVWDERLEAIFGYAPGHLPPDVRGLARRDPPRRRARGPRDREQGDGRAVVLPPALARGLAGRQDRPVDRVLGPGDDGRRRQPDRHHRLPARRHRGEGDRARARGGARGPAARHPAYRAAARRDRRLLRRRHHAAGRGGARLPPAGVQPAARQAGRARRPRPAHRGAQRPRPRARRTTTTCRCPTRSCSTAWRRSAARRPSGRT